jgi:hypothetical protein
VRRPLEAVDRLAPALAPDHVQLAAKHFEGAAFGLAAVAGIEIQADPVAVDLPVTPDVVTAGRAAFELAVAMELRDEAGPVVGAGPVRRQARTTASSNPAPDRCTPARRRSAAPRCSRTR